MKTPCILVLCLLWAHFVAAQETPSTEVVQPAPAINQRFVRQNIAIPLQTPTAQIYIDNREIVREGRWDYSGATTAAQGPRIVPAPNVPGRIILAAVTAGQTYVAVTENNQRTVYNFLVSERPATQATTSRIAERIAAQLELMLVESGVNTPEKKNVVVRVVDAQVTNIQNATPDESAGAPQGGGETAAPAAPAPGAQTQTTDARLFSSDFRPTIILQGRVFDDLVKAKAINIANVFTPNILDFITIEDPLQIRIRIKVAQITLGKDKNIGIQHRTDTSDSLNIPIGVKTVGASLVNPAYPFLRFRNLNSFGDGTDWTAIMNLSEKSGVVKILQEPTLTVMNGQAANFLVGRRIPYPASTSVDSGVVTQEIEFVNVGISLVITPLAEGPPIGYTGQTASAIGNVPAGTPTTTGVPNTLRTTPSSAQLTTPRNNVTPTVDESGMINLYVRPEISSVEEFKTFGTGVFTSEAPVTDVRFVETRVRLRNKESLVLGGLFDEQLNKKLEKVPFISEIPIIGELFKNRTTDDNKKELVFVLTPEIINRDVVEAGDIVRPRLSEMMQHLHQSDIAVYNTKPTRISAVEVGVRDGEAPPPAARATPPALAPRPAAEDPAPAPQPQP
jgi:Flp pilus assembly secretin CpaC